ncbi:MAG: DNA adenine methylase [Armatimonadetes bacterium]|nr:DNA adenine methylase [Armatimonadota bacterium]
MTRPRRPVVRWHGGKFRLRDHILPLFPAHTSYIEPYGGGASILMAKPPTRIEVYNDIDSEVVNLFRVLRDPVRSEKLCRQIELTLYSREEFEDCYAKPSKNSVERARRFVTMSFQCIGNKHTDEKTGWRTRTSKALWSPCLAWTGWPKEIPIFCARLREVIIEHRPALEIFDIYDDEDALFYVDPPYPKSTRQMRQKDVYACELTDDDHVVLLEKLKGLKGMVVLSGYECPLYSDRLEGWTRHDFSARAQTNAPRIESVWCSPNCQRRRQTLFQEIA